MLSKNLATRVLRTPSTLTRCFSLELGLDHKQADNVPGTFHVQTYNKISPIGLAKFPPSTYEIVTDRVCPTAHSIMLRSHKLKEEEVPHTTRCIARCGAGTNNIPVSRMTELGIPVFNTPGANANAVKELVLCGLLLGSRKIVKGIEAMKQIGEEGVQREQVEKIKSQFGGQELKGKTLGVIGLGHIGSATARDASALGMNVVGYDPGMSIESALKLPNNTKLVENMKSVFANCDYISLNIPYIPSSPSEGGTHGIISRDLLMSAKKNAVIVNFARGELVDSEAMKDWFESGSDGVYVSDFPDDLLWDHPNTILLPHLGASTEEAEDAAASMASDTIQGFLENGEIVNSVNFPECRLESRSDTTVRIAIVNENKTGVLAAILGELANANINILQQVNRSSSNIAYNVIDVELDTLSSGKFKSWAELQECLTMVDGVISSRFMNDVYGTGYAKKVEGSYYV
ncbi:hypothetical protein TL16_g09977, partial [Triparma laevis f. inornata]|uniref:phosphoglycerate dehydrogenase n=2 Tax=Triparma laevis TaxID=1534972 RepID=A0A9W7F3Z1_9STRA